MTLVEVAAARWVLWLFAAYTIGRLVLDASMPPRGGRRRPAHAPRDRCARAGYCVVPLGWASCVMCGRGVDAGV